MDQTFRRDNLETRLADERTWRRDLQMKGLGDETCKQDDLEKTLADPRRLGDETCRRDVLETLLGEAN